MDIIIEDDFKGEFIKEFRPLEITTIVDNLISNSEKAKATSIRLNFSKEKSSLVISFDDNGKGIPQKYIDNVYDLGFTTTNGSGIGLFQVKDLVNNSLKGDIDIKSDEKKGTSIKITIG